MNSYLYEYKYTQYKSNYFDDLMPIQNKTYTGVSLQLSSNGHLTGYPAWSLEHQLVFHSLLPLSWREALSCAGKKVEDVSHLPKGNSNSWELRGKPHSFHREVWGIKNIHIHPKFFVPGLPHSPR